jgi:hypothetical protein
MTFETVPPSPESLVESLRSVGYSLPTALADIIDNSIAAGAKNIWVHFHWAGKDSHVSIMDDGCGMNEEELRAAMRHGSKNPKDPRDPKDLGRFGLGLKTASLSQSRNLSVISRVKGCAPVSRTWDLDELASSGDWRLLISPSRAAALMIPELQRLDSGTVVVWSDLDRMVGAAACGSAVDRDRFLAAVENAVEHLSMTFHRFLGEGSLKIYVNGTPVAAWDPFMQSGATRSTATPEERITYGESHVEFCGFVLPHRDRLTDEEFNLNQGPKGWAGQQGFYVYRNKRLLVSGDWLRLGKPSSWTKEEQYRLARIRLDIPNDCDADWHLDVKKSTARPPALLRDRLTELADNVRAQARSVFAHRGKYGKRTIPEKQPERPWKSVTRDNRRVYSVNRDHPAVRVVLSAFPNRQPELEALIRVLEETVPVEQIWLDVAEQQNEHAAPYASVDTALLKADMRRVVDFLCNSGMTREKAIQTLHSMEPFDRYPRFIKEL